MPTVVESLRKLVGLQKDNMKKELATIERMRKMAAAAEKEAIHIKASKG